MDAHTKNIVKNVLAGLISVPLILHRFNPNDSVQKPVIAFLSAMVGKGLAQFLSKIVDTGAWIESVAEGIVSSFWFFIGGFFPLVIDILRSKKDEEGPQLGSSLADLMMIIVLTKLFTNNLHDLDQINLRQVLGVKVVITVCSSVMIFLASLM